MSKRNAIQSAPPFEVDQALKRLGTNLRTARLARNLSIEAAAQKIGVGYRAVASAEAGKPSTSVGVYFGLMWAYGLLSQADQLLDPARDEVALRALRTRERAYPTSKGALDNDF
jgi:transcriptional regulator with XRE-family HTH domain